LALDIAGFSQARVKRGDLGAPVSGRGTAEKSDHRHRRLLRARGERPNRGGTAEERDELASSHVEHGSIPSQWVSAPPVDANEEAPVLALDLPHIQPAAVHPANSWGRAECCHQNRALAVGPIYAQSQEHATNNSSYEGSGPLRAAKSRSRCFRLGQLP
jgi:hypothetical protein